MYDDSPLRLSKMSASRMRISRAWPTAAVLILFVLILMAGRPRRATVPLNIAHNGVHAPYNVHNKHGELLFYNFRSIDPKLLFRGSGFPVNKFGVLGGKRGIFPAAFYDRTTFDFFRAHNIRTIVTLQDPVLVKGERGYFQRWSKATGYRIVVVPLSTPNKFVYDTDARRLTWLAPRDRRFGLKTAVQFIDIMQRRQPRDGAIYLHDDAGKDGVGIVAAAYELWRNQGLAEPDALWAQVMKRYLTSNTVIARDRDAVRDAGPRTACGAKEPPGFVCSKQLEKLRPDLEKIAKL